MRRRHTERGVALIAVMMVLAFVVLIAVSMSGRLQLQLQRQINLQQRQQSMWLALGAEQFIQRLLRKSAAGKDTVNLSQEWATQGVTFPVGQATISGKITDLQACFNLNALQPKKKNNNNGSNSSAEASGESANNDATARDNASTGDADTVNAESAKAHSSSDGRNAVNPLSMEQQAFVRLLEQNAQDLSIPPDYLMARVSDWLDDDSTLQSAGGAEENDYAALERPYYTANGLMVDTSELRTILDVTPADYQLVVPLVCVLPEQNKLQVNVNTLSDAQAPLLAALIPGLTMADAQSLIEARPAAGYDSVDAFVSQNSQYFTQGVPANVKALLSVQSAYFQAVIDIDTVDSSFSLVTIFKMDEKQVQVIARRIGGIG